MIHMLKCSPFFAAPGALSVSGPAALHLLDVNLQRSQDGRKRLEFSRVKLSSCTNLYAT